MLRDIELFEAIRRDDLSTIVSSQSLDIVRNLMVDDLPDMLANHPSFLMVAAYYGSTKCFNYIFEKSQTLTLSGISYQDRRFRSVFHLAAAGGNLEIFKKLSNLDYPKLFSERDGYGNTPLHYAAKYGRISIVQFICSLNVNVLIPNASGCLPSHFAAIFGSLPIIQVLHTNGDSMNAINYNRWTPLHYAIKYQHEDVINYLMNLDEILQPPLHEGFDDLEESEKEDIEFEHNHFDQNYPRIAYSDESYDLAASLIQMAATYGCSSLIKVIIEKARGFDSLNHNGWNFLHFSAANGYSNVLTSARKILNSDDLFLVIDRNKRNLAHLATISGHLDVLVTLNKLNIVLYDKYDKYGKNSLHYACELGYLNLVQYLLTTENRNLLYSADTKKHYTPLHFAAAKGKLDIVKFLLSCHTNNETLHNLEKQDSKLSSPNEEQYQSSNKEHSSEKKDESNQGNENSEKDQLSENANSENNESKMNNDEENPKNENNSLVNENQFMRFNIDEPDIFGMTSLYHAVLNNHYDVALLLLENGANPNIQTIDTKRTPLIEASTLGDLKMVELLCTNEKTNIFLADENGWSAIHYAAQLNQNQIINYLKDIDTKCLTMETNLKQMPFEISVIWAKMEPFFYFIEPENIHMIDINHQDKYGDTALHHAVKKSNYSIAHTLLQLDEINLNILNGSGETPLHLAIERWSSQIANEISLDERCDINLRNAEQLTPLLLAAKLGNTDITKCLIQQDRVDCDVVDSNGDSALHLAARLRNQTIMRLLVNSKRFNLNLENNFGRKPFEILQIYTKKYKKDMARHSDSDSPSINSEDDDENHISDLNEEEENSTDNSTNSTPSSLKNNLKNFFKMILPENNNEKVYYEYDADDLKEEEEEEEDMSFELVYDDRHYSREEEEEEHFSEDELTPKKKEQHKEKQKITRKKILEVEFHKRDPNKNFRLYTLDEKDSVGHCGAESDESFDEFQRLEAEAMMINADVPVVLENTSSEPAFNNVLIDVNKLQEEIGIEDESQEEDNNETVNSHENNQEPNQQ